ncbi:hypothetical protein F4808DRAFT_442170 [Astrocystis sublimbata]|nr:hypothetical protein F4808DRAFT_442170 [Astrocystis sublimbata]
MTMTHVNILQAVCCLVRSTRRVKTYIIKPSTLDVSSSFLQTYLNQILISIRPQSSKLHMNNYEHLQRQYQNMAIITRLEERYVVRSALDRLLRSLFGSDFTAQQQGGYIEVSAARRLTDTEIGSVTSARWEPCGRWGLDTSVGSNSSRDWVG